MPKFLVEATYTKEGDQGLMKDKASGRKAAIVKSLKKLGGKLDCMYYSLGQHDVILVVDLPDAIAVAALAAAASTSGAVHTNTTALLTIDEMDAALEKVTDYRAPGK
jgi:uncharacterized protein with GYD domain